MIYMQLFELIRNVLTKFNVKIGKNFKNFKIFAIFFKIVLT